MLPVKYSTTRLRGAPLKVSTPKIKHLLLFAQVVIKTANVQAAYFSSFNESDSRRGRSR